MTFTNNSNEIYQTWWIILLTRVINYLTKTPTSGMKDLLSSCWSGLFKSPTKLYNLFLFPLVPIAEETIHLRAGTDWKASSLETISCGTRCQVCFQKRDTTSCPTQQWFLYAMTIIALKVQLWHACLGSNHHLSIGLKTD